ncbi:hypothetical protein L2E82_30657 [Cichorium intybus]|uniref:Uncharacterized protein n=1 Tax=Cichorium intybus TaxID=13427 RepID=A0ACB9D1P5_CICIN|nr:hypothetical protein L2E82_30657 [Cichorium intybus]
MLYRLHSIHHTSHYCILIVHFLGRFQSHADLRLLGSSFISDFRFNCRSLVLTSLELHRLQGKFLLCVSWVAWSRVGIGTWVELYPADGEVMDPSMDVTSDYVPVNEPVPTTMEFEEILYASNQVIQTEEQFDDEVQSSQVVPKGKEKNRAKKSSSSTVSEKVDVSVPGVRVIRSRRR